METHLKRQRDSLREEDTYTIAFGSLELEISKTVLEKCETLSEWLKENPDSTRIEIVQSQELFHPQDIRMLFAALDGSFKVQTLRHMNELMSLANAADYLNCDVILNTIASILDDRIAGKSVEEMRKEFEVPLKTY